VSNTCCGMKAINLVCEWAIKEFPVISKDLMYITSLYFIDVNK
jgi:hypothetical protein